jgi:hypothetical protein
VLITFAAAASSGSNNNSSTTYGIIAAVVVIVLLLVLFFILLYCGCMPERVSRPVMNMFGRSQPLLRGDTYVSFFGRIFNLLVLAHLHLVCFVLLCFKGRLLRVAGAYGRTWNVAQPACYAIIQV